MTDSFSTLSWSIIVGNNAFERGGGIYLESPYGMDAQVVTISENIITNNTALVNGGGIYCNHTSADYLSNDVQFNYAPEIGGNDFYCTGTCFSSTHKDCACQSCAGMTTGTGPISTTTSSSSGPVSSTTTTGNPQPPSNHGGAIAAGILIPLIVIAIGVGVFMWWRKRRGVVMESEPLVAK